MNIVTIESPLSGDFERNRRYALWAAYHCFTLGEAAYASHLIFPQFLNDGDGEHRKFGMAGGLKTAMRASDYVAFYIDLGEPSSGMLAAEKSWNEEGVRRLDEGRKFDERGWKHWRKLPQKMFEAFERGEIPNPTPGFGDARLADIFLLLDEHDDSICDQEDNPNSAACKLVEGLRKTLGVGPSARRRARD